MLCFMKGDITLSYATCKAKCDITNNVTWLMAKHYKGLHTVWEVLLFKGQKCASNYSVKEGDWILYSHWYVTFKSPDQTAKAHVSIVHHRA